MLYVVATPIGNLMDISLRALETLRAADLIAAEDTRVTRRLLSHYGIRTPLESYHEHNERTTAEALVLRMVQDGISVALVTDAGTPAISDPGALLVRKAHEAGLKVLAIPGPSALAAALSVSGFANGEVTFYGFLPRGRKELREKLLSMGGRRETAVFYESPRRILSLVKAIHEVYPEAEMSLSAELTKLHERTRRGKSSELLAALRADPYAEKGEYCVALDLEATRCLEEDAPSRPSLEMRLFDLLMRGQTLREAAESLRTEGEGKNAVYAAMLNVRRTFEKGFM